jgi:hypothetical protein
MRGEEEGEKSCNVPPYGGNVRNYCELPHLITGREQEKDCPVAQIKLTFCSEIFYLIRKILLLSIRIPPGYFKDFYTGKSKAECS